MKEMAKELLLAKLRALIERRPDFDFAVYRSNSEEHQIWVAQAYALVSRWHHMSGTRLQLASESLGSMPFHENSVTQIMGHVNRAIADLELDVSPEQQVAFGAGDVYDFFKALRTVVASAKRSVFIIDPFLDPTVFDQYVAAAGERVDVRLLSKKGADRLAAARDKYNEQHGRRIAVRHSAELHDRVVFIDGVECYVIGQSLNVAAKDKATYIVAISPDTVSEKLAYYETHWRNGREV
jgi:hypothetical protein